MGTPGGGYSSQGPAVAGFQVTNNTPRLPFSAKDFFT